MGDNADDNFIEITVLNWERHNPRKDGKKYNWFKVDSYVFLDDKFYSLTTQAKLVWFYILSKCSQVSASKLQLNYKKCAVDCSLRVVSVREAVVAMVKIQMISIGEQFETQLLCTPRIEKNRIDKNRIEYKAQLKAQSDDCATVRRVFFDLGKVYDAYPRKMGKTRGMAKLKTAIKTQADFDNLIKAVNNYSEFVKSKTLEERFVKHFSTWVGEWRDWVEPPKEFEPQEPEWMRIARAKEKENKQ